MLAVRYGIWHDILKQRISSTDGKSFLFFGYFMDFGGHKMA
jgi:hypothetical protein